MNDVASRRPPSTCRSEDEELVGVKRKGLPCSPRSLKHHEGGGGDGPAADSK